MQDNFYDWVITAKGGKKSGTQFFFKIPRGMAGTKILTGMVMIRGRQ